ncbi:hypothetical protein [Vibrio rotiferianus]|uniref:hypothetical protein n=1 Tax=Vibrio rotiferianus TaxID=190895 RepID=UPI002894F1BF|nr:hypothetical protein THOG10_10597 [Vibrio rotiferianus]CAH1559003.1 hypothetical protein THOB06_10601 [Vibrio rotiferianus]
MKIEVLVGDVWVEKAPVNGDWVRKSTSAAHSVEFLWKADDTPLYEIKVHAVDGAHLHSSDFSKITCFENTNLTVSGTLSIPDRRFALPLLRDDGRLTLFEAQVVNGQFDVVLNFPTSGQYMYTDKQANHDLPEPMFTVLPMKIDVLRRV